MLYPIQDFHNLVLQEIFVYESNPNLTRWKHNPDGNPFGTEVWTQINTQCPLGHKHIWRTYDDPVLQRRTLNKLGIMADFTTFQLKCPDCGKLFPQVLESIVPPE